ncbi:TIGR01440 family protein [Lentibacillus saliphilus]|uniref:TIGR01440 family protein n=1 Tax=Lentibacillus saliphilus TaxID=2737028 RepID=UPI001C2FB85E|nr:TIGR01440 family protein [Lentibacillus saliphilus]
MEFLNKVEQDIDVIVTNWLHGDHLTDQDVCVIGCSTSEVIGKSIGTAGSEDVAKIIFQSISKLVLRKEVRLAFQCCEHLNRALVVERETMRALNLTEVTAVPVPEAGGSMATFAYQNMNDPVLVESISADAGIDIGETLIGMHLKHVAVPLRFGQNTVGEARASFAFTRPPLIGGSRAQYPGRAT